MKQETVYASKDNTYVKMIKTYRDDGRIQYTYVGKIASNLAEFYRRQPTQTFFPWTKDSLSMLIIEDLQVFQNGLYYGTPIERCEDIFYMIRYFYETPDLDPETRILISNRLADLGCLYLYGGWYSPQDSAMMVATIQAHLEELVHGDPITLTFSESLNDFAVGVPDELNIQVHFKTFTSSVDSEGHIVTAVYPHKFSSVRYMIIPGTKIRVTSYHFQKEVLVIDEFEVLNI